MADLEERLEFLCEENIHRTPPGPGSPIQRWEWKMKGTDPPPQETYALRGDGVSAQRGTAAAHAQREHGWAESRCLAWGGQGSLSGGGDKWTIQSNPFGGERERERFRNWKGGGG